MTDELTQGRESFPLPDVTMPIKTTFEAFLRSSSFLQVCSFHLLTVLHISPSVPDRWALDTLSKADLWAKAPKACH